MGILSFFAKRFVAGEEMTTAIGSVRRLNSRGLAATLDFLGENVQTPKDAEQACQEYLNLLEAIEREGVKSGVSVKLTQMGLDLGESLCEEKLRRILEKAAGTKNFVRIDMEGSAYTEVTIRLFTKLRRDFSNVGIVIQAYLHRSREDARNLGGIKAPVRVCKGAYKEKKEIAYQDMGEIRAHFQSLVLELVQSGSRVAVATHDEKLIRWAESLLEQRKLNKDQIEFQMLYGLRRKRALELAQSGYAVRIYVPYGTHWLPYFTRRLRERKENVFFVLKGLFAD